ncbi:DNA repair protein RecN [Weissella diestrammenae]|uniref:DNA repair protein RecN n=1 Tax=Weissella diestrammenae TaxID=1162633 RepID=A0A7G9T4B6_9LACO|nr:DNA repair protein RecN [Weissella diestrammenae]MCM0583475.1 DNA repair protein RecN [Weissella diestrammenae]QNN74941.1 DNA repair protein RecN [Weissella diestrammenae]
MLQELSIRDFAIISQLELSFEQGMTVLTGETGAGKSIIIDAVSLLVGGRSSSDFIREGAKKAVLQGVFAFDSSPELEQTLLCYGIELTDMQLVISREIHLNGRNVIRINGTLITATILREIGQHLVDIQGQNEHQELMRVERHGELLDQYAAKVILPLRAKYGAAYQEYQQLQKTLNKRQANEQAFAQRLDMLTYQVNELQDAQLISGEEETLTAEFQELSNFQDVLEALSTAHEALAGEWDGNGLDVVSKAMSALETIEELSGRYQTLAQNVRDAYFELQEASSDILSVRDSMTFDAERLQEVTDRLNLIRTLENKYGATIEDVLAYQNKIENELTAMGGDTVDLETLSTQVALLKTKAQTLADELTKKRQAAADELAIVIHEQLRDLYMEKAVFSVKFQLQPALVSSGQESIEFYIQTNPGETAKPLAKIASGGELSRMMLALKTIFARNQGITSIIFDEVDTGVSGRVAQAMANKIATIAEQSQVLTITHLPQVAAVANQHWLIEKHVTDGRTMTTVVPLNNEQRVEELARMLSGDNLTQAARQNARDLLSAQKHEM